MSIYSGLTISIQGDTALQDISQSVSGIYKQLRQVTSALELDPSNKELLAQKQWLLTKQIEACNKKLDLLSIAISEVQEVLDG